MLARKISSFKANLSVAGSVSPSQPDLWLRALHLWGVWVKPKEPVVLPFPGLNVFCAWNWAGLLIGGYPFTFYCLVWEWGELGLFLLRDARHCHISVTLLFSFHISVTSLFSFGRRVLDPPARAASPWESGRVHELRFRKYSGVTGDTRNVIKLRRDMIQSYDTEYIRTKGESCVCVQETHPWFHVRSRVQSYTFLAS